MAQEHTEKSEIVVTGLGMVTPVGHNAVQTCASIRAGIARLYESEEFRIPNERGFMSPVLCGTVEGITNGQRRFLRLLRMAVPACSEVLAASQVAKTDLQHCGMYLCLSEQDRPGMDNRAVQGLPERLGRALELEDIAARTEVYTLGHAGTFYALLEAIRSLRRGEYRHVIVAAIDTYLDEITLKWLQDFSRLKTENNSKGFIPGEGAAFFMLESQEAAMGRKIKPLARIEGVSTSLETNTIYDDKPCKGYGLSESIQNTLASLDDGGTHTGLVICDLNGERYRSLEWGLALPRALNNNQTPITVWHPADCIGDTGAASSAIDICLGVTALQRGYAKTTNILVWGSSDYGDRGSSYLRAL